MAMAFLDRIDPQPGVAPAASGATGDIDSETLDAAQRGDAAAVERFIRHYQETVFAFLSRVTGRGPHVEDLAQEVFLRAFRALPRFERRADARVSTWLLSIALRLCFDVKKRKTPVLLPLDSTPPSVHGDPEREGQRKRIARAVEHAAAQLSTEQRAVFVLWEFHGLSTDEIARVTGTGRATVKTRLFRARARLRGLLRQLWEEVR